MVWRGRQCGRSGLTFLSGSGRVHDYTREINSYVVLGVFGHSIGKYNGFRDIDEVTIVHPFRLARYGQITVAPGGGCIWSSTVRI